MSACVIAYTIEVNDGACAHTHTREVNHNMPLTLNLALNLNLARALVLTPTLTLTACEPQHADPRSQDAPARRQVGAGVHHDRQVPQHVRPRGVLQEFVSVQRFRQLVQVFAPLHRAGQAWWWWWCVCV